LFAIDLMGEELDVAVSCTDNGYFRSDPLPDPEHGRNLGELYAEILFFDDLVDRARKRIGVYKDKLKIELS
jgi:hypothetical protein